MRVPGFVISKVKGEQKWEVRDAQTGRYYGYMTPYADKWVTYWHGQAMGDRHSSAQFAALYLKGLG